MNKRKMIDVNTYRNLSPQVTKHERVTMSLEKFMEQGRKHKWIVASGVLTETLGWYDNETETGYWAYIDFRESY